MSNFFVKFYFPLLSFSPLFICFVLLFVNSSRLVFLRNFSLAYSFFIWFNFCVLYCFFNVKTVGFQFFYRLVWSSWANFDFIYGIDGISFSLLFLSSLLIPICILCSWNSIKIRLKHFLIFLFLVEFFLLQTFGVLDLFWFYIFFEASLIPMFCIIGIWGSRNRRIGASYQFFLYTFAGSIFFLFSILYLYNIFGSTNYYYLLHSSIPQDLQLFLWVAFFLSFAVKIPMFPVHIWLPEAHVEAPTAGSVLLAGILLKLGSYGFLRYSLCLFPYASQFFSPFIFTLSVIAIIYSSCTTIRQVDLKKIIAYTSVAHMNLVTIGIFCQNVYGIEGSIFLMISHGFVSSGLFLCVGFIYDRYSTRLLRFYGGLVNIMPIFAFSFVILSLANMGLPGTSSFIGEFLIFLGIFNINIFVSFLSCFSIVLSAVYSLWLCNRFVFGRISNKIYFYSDLNFREFFIISFMLFFVFLLGIFPNIFLTLIHNDVSNIVLSFENWPIIKTDVMKHVNTENIIFFLNNE